MTAPHPAELLEVPYWFGTELEGQHVGERTVVVADYRMSPSALPRDRFDHVFLAVDRRCFVTHGSDYDLAEVCAAADSFAAALECPVTLPVLPQEYQQAVALIQRPEVSLAVRVWTGVRIRKGDTVLVRGPAFYVTTLWPEDGIHFTPDNYTADKQ